METIHLFPAAMNQITPVPSNLEHLLSCGFYGPKSQEQLYGVTKVTVPPLQTSSPLGLEAELRSSPSWRRGSICRVLASHADSIPIIPQTRYDGTHCIPASWDAKSTLPQLHLQLRIWWE